MITFNCNKENLMILLEHLGLILYTSDRLYYYNIRKEIGLLVGHWSEISGDGEIMAHRLGEKK